MDLITSLYEGEKEHDVFDLHFLLILCLELDLSSFIIFVRMLKVFSYLAYLFFIS